MAGLVPAIYVSSSPSKTWRCESVDYNGPKFGGGTRRCDAAS